MPFTPNLSDEMSAREGADQLKAAADYAQERIRSKPRADWTPEDKADVRSAVDFIQEYDPIVKAMEVHERMSKPEATAPKGAFATPGAPDVRSMGQRVVDHEKYQEFVRSHGFGSGFSEVVINTPMFNRTTITEGTVQYGSGTDMGVFAPFNQPTFNPPVRRQRLFVRNVLGYAATTSPSVTYIQELNPTTYEGGASTVNEAGPKAEVEMHAQRQDAPIRKIAAWIPVTTEILEDAPLVQSYIEDRLGYMLLFREEKQILSGSSLAPDIRGIYNQVGIQTQSNVGTNDVPATLAAAIAKIENVDGDADAVAMNPLDYWAGLASRHSTQFDNGYGGNAPAAAGNYTWGLEPIRSRSITSGKMLAGSFRLGATLLDRQEVTIRMGNQHSDYFTTNKVAVLAEERIGLAVHRPDFFVDCSITLS